MHAETAPTSITPLGGSPIELLADRPGVTFDEARVHEAWRAAISNLPEQSRSVLIHMYIDELTLAQAAQVLGLTENRVAGLRAQALTELRTSLFPRLAA